MKTFFHFSFPRSVRFCFIENGSEDDEEAVGEQVGKVLEETQEEVPRVVVRYLDATTVQVTGEKLMAPPSVTFGFLRTQLSYMEGEFVLAGCFYDNRREEEIGVLISNSDVLEHFLSQPENYRSLGFFAVRNDRL